MTRNQKLELTWIGKDNQPRLEPRILIEDPEKSYGHTPHPSREGTFLIPLSGGDSGVGNMLIYGDNLLALKALEQGFAGKIKCVCIDPPYNTGSAFEHYDDGLQHSIWLTMMRNRLEILRNLLSTDGSAWIVIDDNEAHYFKVLCDAIFGRSNFFGAIIWQHSVQGKNDAKTISLHHNYIIVYRKSDAFQQNRLPRQDEHNVNCSNPDNDPKGLWRSGDVRRPNLRENLRYIVVTPSGKKIHPPAKGWRWSEDLFYQKVATGEIIFIDNEKRVLRKIYLADQEGRVPESIWFGEDVGTTREATGELSHLLPEAPVFATPKPERLIHRVLQIATNPGDWVLDSFVGSGTTAAVAHKMGRKWIMVELGEHCHTHCLPRLKSVVDGTDQGGISKTVPSWEGKGVGWQGGGGFKYYYLAPSLLKKDKHGNWIIDERYNADMLAAAMAKHEGFRYCPDEHIYWKQGRSTEKDYIFITTQFITVQFLDKIYEEMKPDESLLICCKSFQEACENRYANITIKKIPKMLLGRCEFGREDYSLNIVNMPVETDTAESEPHTDTKTASKKPKRSVRKLPLFDEDDES